MCIDFAADGRLLVVAGRDGRLLHREHDGSLAGLDLPELDAHNGGRGS
jgi:hypothetical protein